jgi:hypothetical protein
LYDLKDNQTQENPNWPWKNKTIQLFQTYGLLQLVLTKNLEVIDAATIISPVRLIPDFQSQKRQKAKPNSIQRWYMIQLYFLNLLLI